MSQAYFLIFIFHLLIIFSSNSDATKKGKTSVGKNVMINTNTSETGQFFKSALKNASEKNKSYLRIFQFVLQNGHKEINNNIESIFFVPETFQQDQCFISRGNETEGGGHDFSFVATQSCSLARKTKELNKLMKYVFKRQSSQLVLIFMCDDLTETALFLKLSRKLMLLSSVTWLVYLDSIEKFQQFKEKSRQDPTILEHFLINARLLLMVEVNKQVDEQMNTDGADAFQFYRVFRPTKNTTIAEFERQVGTDENSDAFMNLGENRFSNMHKNSLVVTGVRDRQYAFDTNITEDSNGNLVFGDSFSTQVLFALEFTMNFTTAIQVTTAWGVLDESTNEWNGMIANLLNGADLAISSAADVPFRRQAVDFNMPTNILRLSAFFKRSTGSNEIFALVKPFQTDFWIALMLWLFLVSVCLIGFKAVISRVERRKGGEKRDGQRAKTASSTPNNNSIHPHMKEKKKPSRKIINESEKLGFSQMKKREREKFHALQESFIDPQEFQYFNDSCCLEGPSMPSSCSSSPSFSKGNRIGNHDSNSNRGRSTRFKTDITQTPDNLVMPNNNGWSPAWREYEIHRHKIHQHGDEGGAATECGEEEIVLWDGPDCFQWAIGTVTLQGFYSIPKHTCYRIIVGTGCLSGVVFYAAYASTLISFLSVSIEAVTNFGQLLSTTYTISIVNSPISNRFLKESPQTSDQEIYRRRRLSPIYSGLEEAKAELLGGSFVFIVEHISAYDDLKQEFTPQESCTIKELTIERAQQRQGTMLPKNSPYKRIIDYQILRMKEYGLVQHWNRKFLPTRTPCKAEVNFEGVEITSVFFAFIILIFGALIAFILFSIEKIYRI